MITVMVVILIVVIMVIKRRHENKTLNALLTRNRKQIITMIQIIKSSGVAKPDIFTRHADSLIPFVMASHHLNDSVPSASYLDYSQLEVLKNQLWNSKTVFEKKESLSVKNLIEQQVEGLGLDGHTEKLIYHGSESIEANNCLTITIIMLAIIDYCQYFSNKDKGTLDSNLEICASLFKSSLDRYSEISRILAYKIFKLKGAISFDSTDRRKRDRCFREFQKAESNKSEIVRQSMNMFFSMGEFICHLE